MSPLGPTDLVDRLAALGPDHPVTALRHRLGAIRSATQGSAEALFGVPPPDGLGADALEQAAAQVARLGGDAALADFHRARASAPAGDSPLDVSIAAFVDRLALTPAAARPVHLQDLREQGLEVPAIVTLAQTVSFESYLVRVLAGLRALAAAGAAPASSQATDGALHAGAHTLVATPPSKGRFTTEVLGWSAWLPTVVPAQATAEQLAVLDESHAAARSSPYYLTLVHAPQVLRQRSRLFNAIMYGTGSLPRAERELATVAVSRINGCTYCASVHARLFVQLTKQPQVIERLFADGVNTPLSARHRAVVDIAVALTDHPPALDAAAIDAARAAGLDDAQILHVVHAAAIFAWANRLMQTLGEPQGPGQD